MKNFWIYLYNQGPLYYKYIAELPSIFSVYYNYTSVFSDLLRSILNLHTHFKYVKKLSNEKSLDIRELDKNFLTYYKIPRGTSNGKIGHFLASLFADSIPFAYMTSPAFTIKLFEPVSCGTVALYGLFIYLFFLADHRATDFTLSKICGTAPRIRRTFQQ